MRILNEKQVTSHGSAAGRKDALQILESGLRATDPYENARSLFRLNGSMLEIGNIRLEAEGDPKSGVETLDLNDYENIYVVGAGKGVQRAAKAIEDALGDRLTGGEVISKHGDEHIVDRVNTSYGAHPIPDEGCVEGAKRILELSKKVTARDLVFTIIVNGGSALLTLPYDGISIEDVRKLTYMLQLGKGVHTSELNAIRSHIDQLKAGRITRAFSPAKMYHLIGCDANRGTPISRSGKYKGMSNYEYFLRTNGWLHNLPDGTTFKDAQRVIEMYDLKSDCPKPILDAIYEADPEKETVKIEEYHNTDSRFFGILPEDDCIGAVSAKARELGYEPYVLTRSLITEAKSAAQVIASIALGIDGRSEPVAPPAALLTTGEMLVTVGGETGVGGRNQEFCLYAAMRIAGNERIVIGSVDSDGTDGPGGLEAEGAPSCLGGAVVDGHTAAKAEEMGIDIPGYLKRHSSSEPLWKLDSGLSMVHGVSANDITVTLIRER